MFKRNVVVLISLLAQGEWAYSCIDPIDLNGVPITVANTSLDKEAIVVHKSESPEEPFSISLDKDSVWFDATSNTWKYKSGGSTKSLDAALRTSTVQSKAGHLYLHNSAGQTTAVLDWNEKQDLFIIPVDESGGQDNRAPYLKFHQNKPSADLTDLEVNVWQGGEQKGELSLLNQKEKPGFKSRELGGLDEMADASPAPTAFNLVGQSISKPAACGTPLAVQQFSLGSGAVGSNTATR